MFNQTPPKIVQTNRLPFFIGLGLLILLMGVFMYKAQVKPKPDSTQSNHRQSIDISSKVSETSWFNDEKFRDIKINPDARHLTAGQVESALKKKEIEDEYATDLEIKEIEDKNRVEEKKLELQAMQSPLSIDVPPPPGAQTMAKAGPAGNDLLTDGLNEITNMVKSATTAEKVSSLTGIGAQLIADFNSQGTKQAFLQKAPNQGEGDDDYLKSVKKKPRSRFEVKAGSYIPAALITGINSELPGNVNAQVTANVYDSITGNYLLIPQGAKLIGEYNSNLSFGQQRVQVVWNRIIFPDGKSVDLEKMQGVDGAGYTGFFDKVDNHYLRIYGNAVLLSLMGAGYDILNQDEQQQQEYTNPRAIVAANVGQKLSDVGDQTLERNMNVQPTLIIDPGYKFKIMVMKDMVLENIGDAPGALSYSE